jgi:formate dehydrogenase major subunit
MSKSLQNDVERTVTLEIDGEQIRATEGQTILEAARASGIEIPNLCEHEALSNVGACRMCLVEIDGEREETACTTTVEDGMEVAVDTDDLWQHRRLILELMFADQNHYCMFCEMEGDCELEDLFNEAGLDSSRFPLEYPDLELDASSEFVTLDADRCIHCGRCVRACDELVGNGTLRLANRGRETTLVADDDVPLGESTCISCGACVQACPTGALYDTHSAYRGREADCERVASTCAECAVGCEIEVLQNDGSLVRIDGAAVDGPSGGQLCETGRFRSVVDDRERVATPLIRDDGEREVTTTEALERVADTLEAADSVTAVASGRLPTETLTAFEEAMTACGVQPTVPGVERAELEATVAAELDEQGLAGDVTVDAAGEVLSADVVVVYDTNVVDTHPVVAAYVRRAANDGATLLTVDDGEDRLERFADASVQVGSPVAQVPRLLLEALDDDAGEREAVEGVYPDLNGEARQLAELVPRLVDGDAVHVVGPGVTDERTLASALTLAAATDGRVLSLPAYENQAVEELSMEAPDDEADVAYLLAADSRETDLDEMLAIARQADEVVVQAARRSVLTEAADVVLPSRDWYEREGTFVDVDGREKQIHQVVEPRTDRESDRQLLAELREVAR